jgi:hypothetical protein
MTKTETQTTRRKRLQRIRESVRAVECLLLELRKEQNESGTIFIPSINDGFDGLYYLQRLARSAA